MDEGYGSPHAATGHTTTDSDSLILVDEADRGVGHLSKALCHEGRGVLHRAFSLLIFNGRRGPADSAALCAQAPLAAVLVE